MSQECEGQPELPRQDGGLCPLSHRKNELKPCPICWGEAVIKNILPIEFFFYLECRKCGLISPEAAPSEEVAVAAWNTRAAESREKPEPVVSARLLEKALRRAYSLGQRYWIQADSESYAQNRRADETQREFETLVSETLLHIDPPASNADTRRLDWIIKRQAWITMTYRRNLGNCYQCYSQDEDEDYQILSGADEYFDSPRQAIDDAMQRETNK